MLGKSDPSWGSPKIEPPSYPREWTQSCSCQGILRYFRLNWSLGEKETPGIGGLEWGELAGPLPRSGTGCY